MTFKIALGGIVVVAFVIICSTQAMIQDVVPFGTIFVGEEGLNLSATPVQPNSQIGWWSPGSSLTTEPSYLFTVDNMLNFYANPQIFSERLGPWYTYPNRILAFNIRDPFLSFRIYDVDTKSDRTEGKVVRGDELQFRVETNLYSLKERPGVSGAPISMYVRDSKGITYTSLVNRSGQRSSIENITVDSSSYFTIPLWDTGNTMYPFGTYEIWAECNANRMKDNYPIEGKTITTIDQRGITPIGITATISTVTTPRPTPSIDVTIVTVTIPGTQLTENVTVTQTIPAQTSVPPTTPTMTPPTSTPGFCALFTIISVIIICGAGRVVRKR